MLLANTVLQQALLVNTAKDAGRAVIALAVCDKEHEEAAEAKNHRLGRLDLAEQCTIQNMWQAIKAIDKPHIRQTQSQQAGQLTSQTAGNSDRSQVKQARKEHIIHAGMYAASKSANRRASQHTHRIANIFNHL